MESKWILEGSMLYYINYKYSLPVEKNLQSVNISQSYK